VGHVVSNKDDYKGARLTTGILGDGVRQRIALKLWATGAGAQGG